MTGRFKIEWHDGEKEPEGTPNPAFPNGMDIDTVPVIRMKCKVDLPYPAKRCGVYIVVCEVCGFRAGITTAGRPDDPRSVMLPCKIAARPQ